MIRLMIRLHAVDSPLFLIHLIAVDSLKVLISDMIEADMFLSESDVIAFGLSSNLLVLLVILR